MPCISLSTKPAVMRLKLINTLKHELNHFASSCKTLGVENLITYPSIPKSWFTSPLSSLGCYLRVFQDLPRQSNNYHAVLFNKLTLDCALSFRLAWRILYATSPKYAKFFNGQWLNAYTNITTFL